MKLHEKPHLVSRNVVQLRQTDHSIILSYNEFVQKLSILIHLTLVVVEQSIQKQVAEKDWPFTLYFVKILEF